MVLLKDPLQKILKDDVAQDVDPDRTWQLRRAQQADFYWRAIQFITRYVGEDGSVNYTQIGSPIASANGRNEDSDVYDYVQNIYRGYGRKFVAALGNRSPNCRAVPDDPDDDESAKACDMAGTSASILRAKWDAELRNLEICYQLWKTGTVFAYTPWVVDGKKYGTTQQPKMEVRQVPSGPATETCRQCGYQGEDQGNRSCPQCGSDILEHNPAPTMDVPEQVGIQKFENGCVEFHLCSVFTISAPFASKDVDDALWLKYEYDESRNRLKRLYPSLRKNPPKDNNGAENSSSTVATIARDSAASVLGAPNAKNNTRWSYTRIWFSTDMYEGVEDPKQYEMLQQYYPDGLKITLVAGEIVDLENENKRDVWAMCKPETSEFMFADAIGQDMISIQDLRNNALNIAVQTFEGGLPFNFVDPRVMDIETWNTIRAKPNAVFPVLGAVGSQLGDAFHQTQPAQLSAQYMPWVAGEEAAARVNVGTTEAIYGGVVSGDQTAHEAELRKNAAQQQLSLTFVFIRKFWERAFTNGVKQLAKFGSGMLRSVRKQEEGYESLMVDLAQLREDGWHFEADEAFPMTPGEQRAYLIWLLGNGQLAEQQGFNDPRNIRKNHLLLGFTDYKTPGVDVHEKALDVISELVKGAPIQKPLPDGSVDTQPSVPIDAFDNHQMMAAESYSWCISSTGRRVRKQNQQGFDNVVAWGKAHFTASQPPKPPVEPPAPKLAISAKLSDMPPDQQQAILEDFHIAPNSPPPNPGKDGSAPKQPGQASQPKAAPPPTILQ